MIKLIRRNQRVFLAGLTIFSMIAFLAQRGSSGQGSGSDPAFGAINGKKIYTSELANARAELQALTHSVRFSGRDGDSRSMLDLTFGPDLAQAIASKPEWFVMLRDEADAADIVVDKDEVASVMVNQAKDPSTGQALDPESDAYAAARAGVTDVYKILNRYIQVASAIKVSKPMRDNVLAKFGQTLEMNVVQLNAGDFLSKVPPPTTQQLQDQFNKFADSPPHVPAPDTNPFGFGYKLPLRSKLQYVRVSADAISAAVIATKSSYEWEVAARKYYLNNPGQFSIKAAATGPSAAPSTMPAVPQTFDQAHDNVIKAIRTPMVDALLEQVQGYIASTLNSDYQAYLQFCSAGKGGAEPDSSLGVRYSSFSYLSKLLDTVQARFKVAVIASETPDYLSTPQIGDIPGVGSADLTRFVGQQALAYLNKLDKKDPAAPALMMRPSPSLAGSDDKTHVAGIVFARLSGVLASQRPADLSVVQSQVQADVKAAAAYKLAQDQANDLQAAARTGNLAIAALSTGHSVIPVQGDNAIAIYATDVKGVVPPLGDSAKSFMKQAFQMTGSYDPRTNPHPAQTIGLPEQGRLFVAQLTNVNAIWTAETYYTTALEFQGEATRDQDLKLREGWFKYDAVARRVGFKPSR